jgi:hypothetical protein
VIVAFLFGTDGRNAPQLLVFPSTMQSQRKEVKEEHCNTLHTVAARALQQDKLRDAVGCTAATSGKGVDFDTDVPSSSAVAPLILLHHVLVHSLCLHE